MGIDVSSRIRKAKNLNGGTKVKQDLHKSNIEECNDNNVSPPAKVVDPSKKRDGKWTRQEDALLRDAVMRYGKKWHKVAEQVGSRNILQVNSRGLRYFRQLQKSKLNGDKMHGDVIMTVSASKITDEAEEMPHQTQPNIYDVSYSTALSIQPLQEQQHHSQHIAGILETHHMAELHLNEYTSQPNLPLQRDLCHSPSRTQTQVQNKCQLSFDSTFGYGDKIMRVEASKAGDELEDLGPSSGCIPSSADLHWTLSPLNSLTSTQNCNETCPNPISSAKRKTAEIDAAEMLANLSVP